MKDQKRENEEQGNNKTDEDGVIDSSTVTFRRTEAQSNEALYSIYA